MTSNSILEKNRDAWNTHYDRSRSVLDYPDENLVRLLQKASRGPALDFGCGSGRHVNLLRDLRFGPVYATDSSDRALDICRERFAVNQDVQIIRMPDLDTGPRIPVADNAFQTIVCWGVLHYNPPETVERLLGEFRRILKPGGVLLGTLRASGDTHFNQNPDMDGAEIRTYDEAGARSCLAPVFADVRLGYIERAPVGELDRRVCHWVFEAGKSS